MFGFAGHHCKPARSERACRHAFHFSLDGSLGDDELFLRGVVVPGNQTIGRSSQDKGGWPSGGITGFGCREKALDVVIGIELHFRERPDDAVLDLS